MLDLMSVETRVTIAEAAPASGVGTHTLRYCERAGLISDVGRADGPPPLQRQRPFLEPHPRPPARRRHADQGYPAACGAGSDGPRNDAHRLAMLEEQRTRVRAQLEEVRTHLAFIDRKITT
jgi:DNA-binding transcriptional MerR regulator